MSRRRSTALIIVTIVLSATLIICTGRRLEPYQNITFKNLRADISFANSDPFSDRVYVIMQNTQPELEPLPEFEPQPAEPVDDVYLEPPGVSIEESQGEEGDIYDEQESLYKEMIEDMIKKDPRITANYF